MDLRPTFRPSRSLILDIKLCFTDDGLIATRRSLELGRHYYPTQTVSCERDVGKIIAYRMTAAEQTSALVD